jgi:hypothetical protein
MPIAFRTGSERKKRVHIFWQKRIVEGDIETRWWYPFKTEGGAMGESRLVFPIPPGVHWKDVKAVELPGSQAPQLPSSPAPVRKKRKGAGEKGSRGEIRPEGPGPGMVGILVGGRIKYVARPGYVGGVAPALPPAVAPSDFGELSRGVPLSEKKRESKKKTRAPKIDPELLAKVREFRDRWLEYVDANGLPCAGLIEGKYDVTRALPTRSSPAALLPGSPALLDHAA